VINRTTITPFSTAGDAVILIENGVYTLAKHSVPVFAVEADVLARGVRLDETIKLVDYAHFVKLCTEYDKVVTW